MRLRHLLFALFMAGAAMSAQPNQQPQSAPPADAQMGPQQQLEQIRQRLQQERQQFQQQMQHLQQQIKQLRGQIQQRQPQGRLFPEQAIGGPMGRWWDRPEVAQALGLTSDQKKKMDDVFQQYRLKSIDLNAAVQKEEAIMEPLVSAEQPDETKILGQIDKVAQARAELEKANVKMLLGIRRLLTQEQWNKLKSAPSFAPQPVPR